MSNVNIGNSVVGNNKPLTLIAGPCQIESYDHAQHIAGTVSSICKSAGINYIFKGSYDKANRTSVTGARGLGLESGLIALDGVKRLGIPTLTDVHDVASVGAVADVVDVVQIPAFLCRQTDLLLEVGKRAKVVNIKKGQFLAPWDIVHAVNKVRSTNNENILLTERGTTFGYNNLVVDMRSLKIMGDLGLPVVMDATHAVQIPGGQGESSGGQREYAELMARCAVAAGIAAVFIETHEDPDNAPSDGPNMIMLRDMAGVVERLVAIDRVVKSSAFVVKSRS